MGRSVRYPFLRFSAGVDWQHVDTGLLAKLNALGRGQKLVITVTSGFRTNAEQAALYKRYVDSGKNIRYIAAKPGSSYHEKGLAVDATVNGSPIFKVFGAATLKEYGLVAPVKGDPVHVQLLKSAEAAVAGPSTASADAMPAPTSNPGAPASASLVPPAAQPPPSAPPLPTAAAPALPGSVDYTIDSGGIAETWRALAADPTASAETKQIAQYAQLATGG